MSGQPANDPLVDLPLSVSAKVLLEMLRQKLRPAELARQLGTTPHEINRLGIAATPRGLTVSTQPCERGVTTAR